MKTFVKQLICVVLVLAILCVPMTASAVVSTDDPRYSYKIKEDGTVRLGLTQTLGMTEGTADVWMIPSTVDGYTVTELDLMYSGIDTKALVVPGTVKELTPYSLSTEFDTLYLSEGLETISYWVDFYSTKRLSEVVIPTTVTSIHEKAFGWYGCEQRDENGNLVPGGSEQVEEFTVYSYGNDVAKEYALLAGYTYVDLSKFAFGDLDIDGAINMLDVAALYQISSGAKFGSPVERVMSDSNEDGNVGIMDVAYSYRRVSGQESDGPQDITYTAWYVNIADTAADTVYDYDTATVIGSEEERIAFFDGACWYGSGAHMLSWPYNRDVDHVLIAVPMMEGGESVAAVTADEQTVYISMLTSANDPEPEKRTAFAMVEVDRADVAQKTVKISREYDDTAVTMPITGTVTIDTDCAYEDDDAYSATHGEYKVTLVESVEDMNAYIDDKWDHYDLNDGFTDGYDETFFEQNVLVLVNCRTVQSNVVISDVSSVTAFADRMMLTLEHRDCVDWLYANPSLHPHSIAVPIPRELYNGQQQLEVLYRNRDDYWASGLFDCSRC